MKTALEVIRYDPARVRVSSTRRLGRRWAQDPCSTSAGSPNSGSGPLIHLLPGQPTEQDGRFFFNDHGRLIPISAHTYRQSLLFQARLLSGHEITFTGVAAILGYQLDRLRRGQLTAPSQ